MTFFKTFAKILIHTKNNMNKPDDVRETLRKIEDLLIAQKVKDKDYMNNLVSELDKNPAMFDLFNAMGIDTKEYWNNNTNQKEKF